MRRVSLFRAAMGFGLLMAVAIGGLAMAGTSMHADVTAVFEAVRNGDASRTGILVKYGDSVIPAIAPLLKDTSAGVRREAVAILDALDSKRSAAAAIAALNDTDSNI